MLSLIIATVTIAIVVYLLVKGYYPQAALFIGGLILLTCTWVFGLGTLLPAKTTTHFGGFDVFKVFSDGFASRIGGLGLMLMAIGGFSRYMEHVGASSALLPCLRETAEHIHNPYLLLGAAFIVEQIMVIFVPSHARSWSPSDVHAVPDPRAFGRQPALGAWRDRLLPVP